MENKTKVFLALAVCSFIIFITFLILYFTLKPLNIIKSYTVNNEHEDDLINDPMNTRIKQINMYLYTIIGSFLLTSINIGMAAHTYKKKNIHNN